MILYGPGIFRVELWKIVEKHGPCNYKHSTNTYRLRYIQDRVFFLVTLNYELIRNLDSYLSYCLNSASYIYVYLDIYGNGGVMLLMAFGKESMMKNELLYSIRYKRKLMVVTASVTVDVMPSKLNRQRRKCEIHTSVR